MMKNYLNRNYYSRNNIVEIIKVMYFIIVYYQKYILRKMRLSKP